MTPLASRARKIHGVRKARILFGLDVLNAHEQLACAICCRGSDQASRARRNRERDRRGLAHEHYRNFRGAHKFRRLWRLYLSGILDSFSSSIVNCSRLRVHRRTRNATEQRCRRHRHPSE